MARILISYMAEANDVLDTEAYEPEWWELVSSVEEAGVALGRLSRVVEERNRKALLKEDDNDF